MSEKGKTKGFERLFFAVVMTGGVVARDTDAKSLKTITSLNQGDESIRVTAIEAAASLDRNGDSCSIPVPLQVEPAPKKKTRQSNMVFTIANIANMIVGSGVITLSQAVSNSGILLGNIFLIISAVFADYSIVSLVKSCGLIDKFTYQDVVFEALGQVGYIIVTLCQIVYPLLALMSYMIAVINNIEEFLIFLQIGTNGAISSNDYSIMIVGLICLLLILPLSIMRNISRLDQASLCSILFVGVYVFIIIYKTAELTTIVYYPPYFAAYARKGSIQSLSTFSFALSCHNNIIPMFRSMRGLSVSRFSMAAHITLFATTIVYCVVAVVGCISFSGNAPGNLLAGYCEDDILATVGRGIFCVTVTLTAPLQVYSSREAITSKLFKRFQFRWITHIAITTFLVGLSFAVAATVETIETIVSISGSLIAAPIVFILPGLVLYSLMKQGWRPNNLTKIGCLVIVIFGFVMLILGTITSIRDVVKHDGLKVIQYWCDSHMENYSDVAIISEIMSLSYDRN